MKQAVREKRNISFSSVWPVESMVFTLYGLHTTAAAVNYAFYTHLTKHYSSSAEHAFLLITLTRDAIQYETKAISARLHTITLSPSHSCQMCPGRLNSTCIACVWEQAVCCTRMIWSHAFCVVWISVNFQTLIITISVIAGVIIIGVFVCCFRCCKCENIG